MLPGSCCIAIATLEPVNGDSWYHMCAFRFHFWGRKVNWNQASHVQASSVQIYMFFAETNAVVIFVWTDRPLLLILRFCGLIFGTARRSQKWDRENAFFSSLLSCACGPKWDHQAFPFLGPCLGSFCKLFASGWRSAMFWFQQKLCGLRRPERQLEVPSIIRIRSSAIGKVYLRAFGAVYQDASSIMGGTKPQREGYTSVAYHVERGRGREKTTSSQFVVRELERNASAVFSASLSVFVGKDEPITRVPFTFTTMAIASGGRS